MGACTHWDFRKSAPMIGNAYYESNGHVTDGVTVANCDSLRLGLVIKIGTNNGCKILANEG